MAKKFHELEDDDYEHHSKEVDGKTIYYKSSVSEMTKQEFENLSQDDCEFIFQNLLSADKLISKHIAGQNLKNFTATEKFLKQPFIVSDSRDDLNSNSFLCGENIYQIKLASDQIYLTLKDFHDNILNQQKVLPGEEINFKNTLQI